MTDKEQKITTREISYNDVADYFLALANSSGEVITNLKLQKLVYYAQAWYLAIFSKPLFQADFEAWVHGPVIPDLYRAYKEKGFNPIIKEIDESEVKKKFNKTSNNFLNEVAQVYMPFGAFQLELMTHNEDPWIKAREGFEPDEKCDVVISKEIMKNYYGQKIKDQANSGQAGQ